jgi:hypothetical protein
VWIAPWEALIGAQPELRLPRASSHPQGDRKNRHQWRDRAAGAGSFSQPERDLAGIEGITLAESANFA